MSHSKVKRESRKNVVWKKSELEGMKTIKKGLKTLEINNGIISLIEAKILLKFYSKKTQKKSGWVRGTLQDPQQPFICSDDFFKESGSVSEVFPIFLVPHFSLKYQ